MIGADNGPVSQSVPISVACALVCVEGFLLSLRQNKEGQNLGPPLIFSSHNSSTSSPPFLWFQDSLGVDPESYYFLFPLFKNSLERKTP